MENDDVNKKSLDISGQQKKLCYKCNKIIHPGEYYVESILTGNVICSECDEGLLITGDVFYSIDE